ncbi:hypothetical protein F0P96_05665 [Hymenobacter busanensis]|uniref:Uncharacterized protein n=1 Tax=Hymenobacter busanensis TaxID=2607656 RepID=A0A7L5A0E6_9BACT|nr:hypothetical protein [Hymenobacter busanensis]KAA9338322.1 hypothetical protein F0P96_05665 [Hymenobacter busanensis]QHJ09254.1 hypothetical protein GUY19_18945 [Hymenobacter busanensis]
MPSSYTRIGLQPANTSRVPFFGQLVFALVAIAYPLLSIMGDPNRTPGVLRYLDWMFLVLAVVFLLYILVQNLPLFGTQTYLEITPAYLVHKPGLFIGKQPFAARDLRGLDLEPRQLLLRMQDGTSYSLNLRQVRGKRRRQQLRGMLQEFAQHNKLDFREQTATEL